MAFRRAFSHCIPKAATILVELAVAYVQDLFAAHAAYRDAAPFQGGTLLAHATGCVDTALWYQLLGVHRR